MRLVLAAWIAWSAGGTLKGGGGSISGGPETVPIVTTSPLSIVAIGCRPASN
jgi:hypothetical protein